MKKLSLTLIFLVIVITLVMAVKVKPGPRIISQPDGTTLTIYGHGDEHFHYYTTADNVLLYQDGHKYYIATVDQATGTLKSSGVLAHNDGSRSNIETTTISKQAKTAFFDQATAYSTRAKILEEAITSNSTYFPHTGSPKAIVILVNFTDTVFQIANPKYVFDRYLNAKSLNLKSDTTSTLAKNYGSVLQYFNDMSGGGFTPQFDVFGPVTLPHSSSYYGNGDICTTLTKHACDAAKDLIDFSEYDANNDGYVDLVYVIYAGYAQSITGNTNDIWPQSGCSNIGTYNGKIVYRYGVNNELNDDYTGKKNDGKKYVNGIGLFCHEFSHTLGLPDMYYKSAVDNQEMEMWDLMDGGEYTYDGYYPTPYTPWEKEAMGWLSLDTLKTATNVTLSPLSQGGKAYRILNDADSDEYYMLEDIQKTGWQTHAYGHGMLIYHVNYDASAFTLGNFPNSSSTQPRMTIFPADGRLISSYNLSASSEEYYQSHAGDPFPGTSNTTSFTDTTTIIKSIVYNGSTGYMSKPITAIAESAEGIITFKFMGGATGINEAVKDVTRKDDNRIYALNGMYLGTDISKLSKGIYIRNRKKFIK